MCKKDDHSKTGCQEYNELSRRHFLGMTAGALAATMGPAWLPKVAYADSHVSNRDVMVSIFLRGGADPLSLCVPYFEDNYYNLRPTLAFGRPNSSDPFKVTALDDRFGLPPAMTALLPAYDDGALAFVHATGSQDPTRSHFEAMHQMEVGQPQPPVSLFTGWLGRHLASTSATLEGAALRAVALGFGLPRTLVGSPLAVPVDDPSDVGYSGFPETEAERRQKLESMYRLVPEPMRTAAENTQRTVDLLQAIDFAGYLPADGATYPENEFGQSLRSAAALIKAEVGVEAVTVDAGGWDTHENEGPQEGTLAGLMRGFAEGLAAFQRDLFGSGHTGFVATVMSEFGRNVIENASRGTDHGHGSMMMVMGGGIRGGQVFADWPGLDLDQLYEQQDLAVTIDYRDILTEIVTKRLGNPDFRSVFPDAGYTPVDHGIVV